MKAQIAAALVVLCFVPASLAKDQKDESPVMWGTLDQNAGCVIFREHRKLRGMYWGIAVTTEEYSELDVVETQNYTMPQQKYKENQESMDELQRIAAQSRIKFVKIPGKVTPQGLDQARAMCKPDYSPTGSQP